MLLAGCLEQKDNSSQVLDHGWFYTSNTARVRLGSHLPAGGLTVLTPLHIVVSPFAALTSVHDRHTRSELHGPVPSKPQRVLHFGDTPRQ